MEDFLVKAYSIITNMFHAVEKGAQEASRKHSSGNYIQRIF